jgi:hypothetical protein
MVNSRCCGVTGSRELAAALHDQAILLPNSFSPR